MNRDQQQLEILEKAQEKALVRMGCVKPKDTHEFNEMYSKMNDILSEKICKLYDDLSKAKNDLKKSNDIIEVFKTICDKFINKMNLGIVDYSDIYTEVKNTLKMLNKEDFIDEEY